MKENLFRTYLPGVVVWGLRLSDWTFLMVAYKVFEIPTYDFYPIKVKCRPKLCLKKIMVRPKGFNVEEDRRRYGHTKTYQGVY
jgi:hypothetical protein